MSQAARWSSKHRRIQYRNAIKVYDNALEKWIEKRGEIPELRPLLEAVLTSVCLSAETHRPERVAALPQESCQ